MHRLLMFRPGFAWGLDKLDGGFQLLGIGLSLGFIGSTFPKRSPRRLRNGLLS